MRSTGFSVIIGSWKIIAIRLPRSCRISSGDSARRSRPSSRIAAVDDAARRIDEAHDRVAGHRLAGARFADEAQHLAARDA